MKKNIYANLDLTLGLSDFQETVTKLLELTDVKEWDGRIIKFREQEIREAALILAGHKFFKRTNHPVVNKQSKSTPNNRITA